MTLEYVARFSKINDSTTTTTLTLQQQPNDYKCFNCQISCVRGDPSLIRAMGNLYHRTCFKCHSCQISVIDKFYIMDSPISRNQQDHHVILCERDYHHHQTGEAFKCHQCNQPIESNYELIGIYKYHKHCLHCPGCIITKSLPPMPVTSQPTLASPTSSSSSSSTSLSSIITSNDEPAGQDSLESFNYNNRPYCRYHYSLIKGTECIGCGQTVLYEQRAQQQQQQQSTSNKWHPECYNLMKYYQVNLADLFSQQANIKSKTQLFTLQNECQHVTSKIWKETSQFEDATFKIISKIVSLQQTDNSKKLFEACQLLFNQVNILFSVLDLVFKCFTHLSLETPIQKFSDQLVYFLNIICQQEASNTPNGGNSVKLEMKFVNILSQSTRDLVKLSLQQTILLEWNFGAGAQDNGLIDQVIRIYSNKLVKKRTIDVSCLDHHLQLIDMSMTRLAFVLDITPFEQAEEQGQQAIADETILFKPTMIITRPTLYPLPTVDQQNSRMIQSTSNIHQYQQQQHYLTKSSTITDIYSASTSSIHTTTDLKRSKSTSKKPTINHHNYSLLATPLPILQTSPTSSSSSSFVHITPIPTTSSTNMETVTKNTTSRMDSIRRALTTSRSSSNKKENGLLNRSNSIFGSNTTSSRKDQRSFSLHNPSTSPLYISLPDVEQLNQHHYKHTTPPLSPPSIMNNQYIESEAHLPDLTRQQDCIIRHIAILYIESHASSAEENNDDLLSFLISDETSNNTKPSSLWGKLKTHILTPGALTESANLFNNPNLLSNNASATTQGAGGGEKKFGVPLSQNTSSGSLTSSSNSSNCYKIPENCKQFENWKTHCPSVMACFSQNSCAPNFLKDCILAMIDQDVNMEGIFRKNGNIRLLKETCDQLDENGTRESWFDFFRQQQIIQLAAFVKRYLRELPEPILTYKLHKLFLMSNNNKVEEDITIIHYAICMLPKINRDILLLVLALLNWVARHSEDNKMDFDNLARVMTPNILYNGTQKKHQVCSVDVTQCHNEIRIVAIMIQYYDIFVKVPNEFTVLLNHPKMAEYICNNSIDLTCSKQFTKSFNNLTRMKKEIIATSSSSDPSNLPPSLSTSVL